MWQNGAMTEYQLSLGAHLLLWVFPFSLVIIAIVQHVLSGHGREDRP